MNHSSHVFSGNPLDRGHIERRSEKWLSEATRDHSSRFLLFYGSKVGLSKHPKKSLLWTNTEVIDFVVNPAVADIFSADFIVTMQEVRERIRSGTFEVPKVSFIEGEIGGS